MGLSLKFSYWRQQRSRSLGAISASASERSLKGLVYKILSLGLLTEIYKKQNADAAEEENLQQIFLSQFGWLYFKNIRLIQTMILSCAQRLAMMNLNLSS